MVSQYCSCPGERFSAATPQLTALRTRVRCSRTLTYVHTPAAPSRFAPRGLPQSAAPSAMGGQAATDSAESFRLSALSSAQIPAEPGRFLSLDE